MTKIMAYLSFLSLCIQLLNISFINCNDDNRCVYLIKQTVKDVFVEPAPPEITGKRLNECLREHWWARNRKIFGHIIPRGLAVVFAPKALASALRTVPKKYHPIVWASYCIVGFSGCVTLYNLIFETSKARALRAQSLGLDQLKRELGDNNKNPVLTHTYFCSENRHKDIIWAEQEKQGIEVKIQPYPPFGFAHKSIHSAP